MKRSYVNRIIEEACLFLASHQFHLPPFASWSEQEWRSRLGRVQWIIDRKLGWDITDFGMGDFEGTGLILFTLRNGAAESLSQGRGMVYCEKVLIAGIKQITPHHFHWSKTEDIINRAGGTLAVELFNADTSERLDNGDVSFLSDGVRHTVPAGTIHRLAPGESITVPPGLYHSFWAEGERVLAGEISSVSDDDRGNRFLAPLDRFPNIEEDAPIHRLLVSDYSRFLRH